MNKILLVYEDYADLMSVEATLKKVGFDVIGLSSEYSIAEQMLAFNPDLVVGNGKGGKVSSLGVGKRLKEMTRWQGKSVLIFPANFKPNPQELIRIRVDMILEAPVAPLRLVQVIGKILGHDEAVLLERLNKAMHVESPQKAGGNSIVGGKAGTENEAIYVKGVVPEGAEEGTGDASLQSERIHEESQQFTLNPEEETKKFSFKFGDRMSEATSEKASTNSEESAFPDVDLKALERELLGGGAPEVERVDVLDNTAAEDESLAVTGSSDVAPEIQAKAKADLEKAEEGLKDRVSKYSNIVADVKVSPKSTVTRVEARRRQRELAAHWDGQNLSDLDKLRQEFAKALFKK
ncbi:hypothetical protein AZI87_00135 [Bdellovibrio bacteriovorus]|uniref:Protein containing CheY-like receiver n=1 Tax=Bdellovibrio bacteriovorus TaxID=959 RepID=A0A162GBH6_BDEBC|nr:hypothetical protein [Bdellovibrio bacteriovorus]KYG67731.1 hypothetical protein AZI87_00135 [Bdellovibrio bacteriovorus]